jgi:hypothetical protein
MKAPLLVLSAVFDVALVLVNIPADKLSAAHDE